MSISKSTLAKLAVVVLVWILLALALALVILIPPAVSTVLGWRSLTAGNIERSTHWWTGAHQYVTTIDQLLNQRSPLLNGWSHVLALGLITTDVLATATETSLVEAIPTVVSDNLPNLQLELAGAQDALDRCFIAQALLPDTWQTRLTDITQLVTALETVLSRDSVWLILLQNANELRASGGFMGSYALVYWTPGEPLRIVIEDIYDADGQFTGLVQAPPGVAEYLSGGKGMRLPDANWSSDFPLSAQQVLAYFALGQKQGIDGVIAINNQVIASLLQITGPLPLPDYDTVLTTDTIDTVLHQRPNEFFPGSIQKKHLLGQAQAVLMSAVAAYDVSDYSATIASLINHAQSKNILIYSPHPDLQSILTEWHMSGALPEITASSDVLAFVESNVGINKINQWVSRTINLTKKDVQLDVELLFTNHSAADRYLNYQRVITPPDWTLDFIHGDVPDTASSTATSSNITFIASNGQEYAEHGFLVSVPANSQRIVKLSFTAPTARPSVLLVKQPGLTASPVTITSHDQIQKVVLDTDRLINW